jgi:hypothetical protein
MVTRHRLLPSGKINTQQAWRKNRFSGDFATQKTKSSSKRCSTMMMLRNPSFVDTNFLRFHPIQQLMHHKQTQADL